MKIREQLINKIRKAQYLGSAFILIIFVVLFTLEPPINIVLVIFFVVVVVSIVAYIEYFIKCPKCKVQIGSVAKAYGGVTRKKYILNYCPNCGASLNEEI